MAASEVSFAHLTPGFAELLATSAADDFCLTSLRYVFFVGDKLTRRDVARLRRLAPGVTCIGSYGATETQRAVGFKLIPWSPDHDDIEREVYPLGRGVKDTQLLVLNRARQLAGIGELGEIYVRSPHLAIGYLDQDLTREKFQTNPCTGLSGDRLYKTGDLGRYLPDGEVEFAGRADRQIKIRGFRVEPEEIEAALCQHPLVKQSLVTLRADSADQTQIVAYVVPVLGDRPPGVAELRQFLKSRVPHYMVPNAFGYLEALPLTPNGKLDFQALPTVEANHVSNESEAPREESELERKIARVWEDVLHTSAVRVHDNFFDLGGQSLLAVRVISRLRDELQIDISLREFFENPTVRSLAASLNQALENPSKVPEMAQILSDLELLSDDEAEQIVSAK
jgi:acyl-coenzyme A synthetase/AMP-(fatty) acid ligase/acyl carrier protein